MTDQQTTPDPARFATSKMTLFVDRAMTWLIRAGGVGIIIAVFGIFLFIGTQVVPLFRSARVSPGATVALPDGVDKAHIVGLISDEWGELPTVISANGKAAFVPQDGTAPLVVDLALGAGVTISAAHVDHLNQRFVLGTSDGRLLIRRPSFAAGFNAKGARTITGEFKDGLEFPVGTPGAPLLKVAFGENDTKKLIAAIQHVDGKPHVITVPVTQKRALIGPPKLVVGEVTDLTAKIAGNPEQVLVDERGDSVLVATADGTVYYFFAGADDLELRQTFRPFDDQPQATLSSIDYLLGDVSLVLTNPAGINRLFSLYIKPGTDIRQFGHTKTFDPLDGGATSYAPSVRNKSFLITHDKEASLRYGTSASTRWEDHLDYPITHVALSGKYHRIFLLDDRGTLHSQVLDDPHPESGLASLFSKVWYEGADRPAYVWQSSGSDDSEPKMSMIPLIIGSIKGTIYA
ncbi:MAG TPA: hypothetical protein VHX44_17835, partial [Planctomycetota bacterium]|nr:hypothetical protein [Planctomycetota bacterium]